jgi:cell wall-associated NlpC family hydrolase
MKKIIFLIAAIMVISVLSGKEQKNTKIYSTAQDEVIYDKYISFIKNKATLPTSDIIIETAKFFLETPYVANTLEKEPEGLVINLRELDCTTFVENVFALTITVKSGDFSFENYCDNLRNLRYRGGIINDYTDRLHYTSDWIDENEKKGVVKNVSALAGGVNFPLNLYVMSSNTTQYKQLKGNPELIKIIANKEKEIASRKHYFIPTESIDANQSNINSGDMVGFVTTLPGIDISHVGIIYKEGSMLTFIHASSTAKKVIINKEPLSKFVKSTGRNTGIVIARLLK